MTFVEIFDDTVLEICSHAFLLVVRYVNKIYSSNLKQLEIDQYIYIKKSMLKKSKLVHNLDRTTLSSNYVYIYQTNTIHYNT